jgi:uridine kinase
MGTPFIIGITGGSGSGKTSLLKMIREEFSHDELAILTQDNYYKPREEQSEDSAGVKNFDLPASIILEEYSADLKKLQQGQVVERMEYTYNNEKTSPSYIRIEPAPVIITEGLFIMHLDEVRALLDLTIYIEVNDVLKLKRRILRDKVERNYPLEDVLYRYEHHVLPAYKKYIQPYKAESSIIINNNANMDAAMHMIVAFVRSLIE